MRTLPGAQDLPPDARVDLSAAHGEHLAFPEGPRRRKNDQRMHDPKVNYHPERDTMQYRRGSEDKIKYAGREDLFSGQ